MMQALEAGGFPILTDNIRKKDEDNPKGYYEFELVKKTIYDPGWLLKAQGKAVKMVYRLLYDLPDEYEYRVLFMQREVNEVLASQKIMLKRLGKQGATISDEKLANIFKSELTKFANWITSRDNFSIIYVDHKDMIFSPEKQCEKINNFLGNVLDINASATIVEPSLYRSRIQ